MFEDELRKMIDCKSYKLSTHSPRDYTVLIQYNLCKTATKIDKTKILMTNGSLTQVESITECILQYF